MSANTLAMDFGTSNSAVAVLRDGVVWRLPIEQGAETLPTAVFFDSESGEMRIGKAAEASLIAGDDGRYMRALKSILGTGLFHESRLIGGKRRTLAGIVTEFLASVKARAEAHSGLSFARVMSGRPVHFHSGDPARDAQAEADLRACYLAAGFDEVAFLFEPEAAALASHGLGRGGEVGLIVDIGGGTSDFTVFRARGNDVDILASHGIRLGGTDFDHAVSMSHAMPLLGLGGQLRRTFGEGLLPVPRAIYVELSTWAMIPFLYSRDTLRSVDEMAQLTEEPEAMARLARVVTDQLGHELAFAVERGKIAANAGERAAEVEMGFVAPGLVAPVSAASLGASLERFRDRLREAVYATLFQAQVRPAEVGTVILVGGSSLMKMIEEEARAICPAATLRWSEAFTAVVDGLAIAAARG